MTRPLNPFITGSATLLLVLFTGSLQANPLQCRIDILDSLGWNTVAANRGHADTINTCDNFVAPVFHFSENPAEQQQMIELADAALDSDTSRCLMSRSFGRSVRVAIDKLIGNQSFTFPRGGTDPRDPFIPPEQSWLPAHRRGYDSPRQSVSGAIESLYQEPFIAECAAAKQIGQIASLYEHYKTDIDDLLHPREIGIGLWQRYLSSPAIRARIPLLVNSTNRKNALSTLAELGQFAFNGQMGYLRASKGEDYIDSPDNRGQNFIITRITPAAVEALRERKKPLKELSAISKKLWRKYSKKLQTGATREELRRQFETELENTDPFFREADIYVHPLGVRTFAFHIARQFRYNPRTPYILEIYEDHLSGYTYQRFLTQRKFRCDQQAYCRKIDKRTYLMVGKDGKPRGALYNSVKSCLRAAAVQ